MDTLVLGGGCFWCTEAVFARVNGVKSVLPGYAGGHAIHPTYETVCSGETGHAEVVQLEFDSSTVSLEQLLTIFFSVHDPTTLNRQGNDVGTQYRSIILCTSDAQMDRVQFFVRKKAVEHAHAVVTEIRRLDRFYPAEQKHERYYDRNPDAPYCRLVIAPKLEKLDRKFSK
ncbi:peptide-methionine (S)-S-oxide reductase MsrA [Candidatus Micrarchaeota archaeon]|nr:peptide-methionine (S)-S-oxide reductase MsrA [Candidatus Micrarchaeota archaeon]